MSIGCIISAFVFCLPHKKYGLIGYILPTLSAPPVVGSFLTFMGAALIYYVTMPNIFGRGPWNYITGTALRNNIIVFALTCAFTIALFIGLRKRGAQGIVRGICVLLGLLFGIIVAAALGITDFSPIATAPWFALPKLFIGFNLGSIDMLALGSIIAMTIVANLSDLADTIGAYATAERMYPEGSTGLNIERTNRGVFFKMLWSGIAVLFGAQPTVAYPERVVLIQMSGVWSNKQITWVGVMMIISGLIYKVGMFGASIPPAVLAATTIISMSMLTYAGIRIITYMEFTDRNMMIVGFSICAGMLCLIMPTWFQDSLPYFLNIFFGSAILVCFVVAWIMYIFLSYLPARRKKTS
jgi:xanthine/uracil permease